MKYGGIPPLVMLLTSTSPNVAEQAVWALGNIAGDGAVMRNLVLQHEALPLLIDLIKPDTPVSKRNRRCMSVVSSLSRSTRSPFRVNIIRKYNTQIVPICTYPLTTTKHAGNVHAQHRLDIV